MFEYQHNTHIALLLVGVLTAVSLFAKAVVTRFRIPALVGWIAIGVLARCADEGLHFLDGETERLLGFLAEVGVAVLLFRIGLESNLPRLVAQLGRAGVVWVGNVAVSGAVGYVAARFLLDLPLLTSLTIGIALTATSVGVTVGTWKHARAMDSPEGELLLDVAELDDASSIILMGLLFAVLPALQHRSGESPGAVLGGTAVSFAVRMAIFAAGCLLFARYGEARLTSRISRLEHGPDPMITVVGMGFVIASVAALLGFSVALGAFFAGLAFSRDPRAVKSEASFQPLYELFCPFFFIHIGMGFSTAALPSAAVAAAVLLAAAVVGKTLGTVLPAAAMFNGRQASLLAVSMVPRAEITMIIMQRARASGSGLIPDSIYTAMITVSILTCVGAPVVVDRMLTGRDKDARR